MRARPRARAGARFSLTLLPLPAVGGGVPGRPGHLSVLSSADPTLEMLDTAVRSGGGGLEPVERIEILGSSDAGGGRGGGGGLGIVIGVGGASGSGSRRGRARSGTPGTPGEVRLAHAGSSSGTARVTPVSGAEGIAGARVLVVDDIEASGEGGTPASRKHHAPHTRTHARSTSKHFHTHTSRIHVAHACRAVNTRANSLAAGKPPVCGVRVEEARVHRRDSDGRGRGRDCSRCRRRSRGAL